MCVETQTSEKLKAASGVLKSKLAVAGLDEGTKAKLQELVNTADELGSGWEDQAGKPTSSTAAGGSEQPSKHQVTNGKGCWVATAMDMVVQAMHVCYGLNIYCLHTWLMLL